MKDYFEKEGFDRWSRIYSEDAEVNTVQLDIREGHAMTVDKVDGAEPLDYVRSDPNDALGFLGAFWRTQLI